MNLKKKYEWFTISLKIDGGKGFKAGLINTVKIVKEKQDQFRRV